MIKQQLIFPGTKSLAQKRAALGRIKWPLSAYFSLGQQENFSLYINIGKEAAMFTQIKTTYDL